MEAESIAHPWQAAYNNGPNKRLHLLPSVPWLLGLRFGILILLHLSSKMINNQICEKKNNRQAVPLLQPVRMNAVVAVSEIVNGWRVLCMQNEWTPALLLSSSLLPCWLLLFWQWIVVVSCQTLLMNSIQVWFVRGVLVHLDPLRCVAVRWLNCWSLHVNGSWLEATEISCPVSSPVTATGIVLLLYFCSRTVGVLHSQ